ncbi:MAG TPA: hypothetical protein VIF83_09000, partial [Gemmatimonadaceae bacterium]
MSDSRAMRRVFIAGVLGLVALEIAIVYFIMPLPGSQRMRSIDAAYLIYSWRWALRGLLWAMVLSGVVSAWRTVGWQRWLVPASLLFVVGVTYMTNFQMSADRMFLQPRSLIMRDARGNKVALDRLVVGIDINGDVRAYPLQFIG